MRTPTPDYSAALRLPMGESVAAVNVELMDEGADTYAASIVGRIARTRKIYKRYHAAAAPTYHASWDDAIADRAPINSARIVSEH